MKEQFAIVMAVYTLGALWQRQKILIYWDNLAVVAIWESGSTRAKETVSLVCLLYYCAARYNINIYIVHIAGVNNVIADCLSHFQQNRFRQLALLANPTRYHPCVADTVLHRHLLQCRYFGVAPSTRQTY